MTPAEIRTIIRDDAKARGLKYRITAKGEVHYHSSGLGWYLSDTDAEALAHAIVDEHGAPPERVPRGG